MAVYTKDGNAISLNKIWAYAKEKVESELTSALFNRSVILAFLAGKAKSDSALRPGSMALIGSAANGSMVQQAREREIEIHQRMLIDRVGAVKMLGERDTMPSTGNKSQDQNVRTAVFRYSGLLSSPVKIWKETLRNSTNGGLAIADPTDEATEQGMEELLDSLALRIWRKAPSDQSANVWDNALGIVHALNDDNTYGNLDRSTTTLTPPSGAASQITNYWAGIRDTTARAPSVDLVDQAMYKLTIPLYLRQNRAPDLWLCGGSAFYTIKKEAFAKGGNSVTEEIPEFSKLGTKFEAVKYGNSIFVADPLLTGDWSADDGDITDATKLVAGIYTDDWAFSVHPSENFRMSEFEDLGKQPGGDDAIAASINVKYRLRCKRPWRSVLFTNVG